MHGHLLADGEQAGKLRTSTLHHQCDGRRVCVAGIHEPCAIAVEDRQHGVEDIAHHLFEIIRALDRKVHSIGALNDPATHLALIFRTFSLSDVHHDTTAAGRAVAFDYHSH